MPRRRKRLIDNYTSPNRVRLVRGGGDFFNCLLQMITNARESIHIQTYIYNNDETGLKVAEALKVAASRNVNVYLLPDGYASRGLPKTFINNLEKVGIHFRFFEPIFKSRHFYFGRRLHHKVAVVDAKYALVGGINIADRYNDMPERPGWLDFALYMEGTIAQQLCTVCWKTWNSFPAGLTSISCKQDSAFNISPEESSEVSMRRNDWVRRKNEISATYINMFRNARSHITILSSYFLPGRAIRRQLAKATARGVRVQVVTAGMSDIALSKYAERFLYDWLLRKNIELYEYQPRILHGKIAVCDGEWLTIGSYNINNISAYASIELNMNVRDARFAKETKQVIQQIIENDCVQITPEYHRRNRNVFKRFINWLSYIFIRMLLYLFTFYFKHEK